MKTLTEFNGIELKTALVKFEELLKAGKTTDELSQTMGEVFKRDGDKLKLFLNALETIKNKSQGLKRVVVLTVTEKDKVPAHAEKRDEFVFLPEYYPALAHERKNNLNRRDRSGRGPRGKDGKGGRGDKREARGKRPARPTAGRSAGPMMNPAQVSSPDGKTKVVVYHFKNEGGEKGKEPLKKPRFPRAPRGPRRMSGPGQAADSSSLKVTPAVKNPLVLKLPPSTPHVSGKQELQSLRLRLKSELEQVPVEQPSQSPIEIKPASSSE